MPTSYTKGTGFSVYWTQGNPRGNAYAMVYFLCKANVCGLQNPMQSATFGVYVKAGT